MERTEALHKHLEKIKNIQPRQTMKNIKSILFALLCLVGAMPAQRLTAQDIDVTIDWGNGSSGPAQMISPKNGAPLTT